MHRHVLAEKKGLVLVKSWHGRADEMRGCRTNQNVFSVHDCVRVASPFFASRINPVILKLAACVIDGHGPQGRLRCHTV
jgi:hypothetical protein